MPRIAKEALTPGMKLAKPIAGQNGMVLLAEGTELTEKWIERIQDMDVAGVFVEGDSQPAVPLAEALAGLEKRFATVQQEPHMGLIKKAVRAHIESLYP
ncbi:MAG: hypothetical protein M0009_05560 [Deltaproteobacteria bacterium]|nr:hypothetical protein [Deltaproteobacteria bacterium]